MPGSNFQGLTVLTLENRRGQEISKLIETYGGTPVHAAAMREVPLESNSEALHFAEELFAGKVDIVVFLTGVGARAIWNVVQTKYAAEQFVEALQKVPIFARGPKPVAVLQEWNVRVALTAPEPNTWRELLEEIDRRNIDLREKTVAVQEYGVSNPELLRGLRERGAQVLPVPVYQWDLPEDLGPLRTAIREVVEGGIDVALFTTGMQVAHLFEVAEREGLKDGLKSGLDRVVKASIGPTTSEVLRSYGLSVDLEASHPKMGYLVKEAAEQSQSLVARLRERRN
jgi:uroporphyrinogen-III synthase